MYARLVTWNNAKNIDNGVAYLREKVMPTISGLKGFRGVTASADLAGDDLSVVTLWESEGDRDASLAPLSQAREEATEIIQGDITLESFEQLVAELGLTSPIAGSWLQARSLSMEPEKIEQNLIDFRANVLPHIKSNPGFQSVRVLMDRTTGIGRVGTVWSDEASMMKDSADAGVRLKAVSARNVNVTLGEPGFRRVLLANIG